MSGAKTTEEIFSWIILEGAHNAITNQSLNKYSYYNFRAVEDFESNLDMLFWNLFYVDRLFNL